MPETPDFPLHRLNIPKTKLWLISKVWRNTLATNLARHYRGGVGVCAATLRLIAFIDPRGNIRELTRPFKKYEMWQIANKPAIPECPCMDYYDPEVGGPYRERGDRSHHPFCQFEQTAGAVFKESQGRAANRLGLSFDYGMPMVDAETEKKAAGPVKQLAPQARPDEWETIRKNYKGK